MLDGLIFHCSQQRSSDIFKLNGEDFFDTLMGEDDIYGFTKFTGVINIKGYVLKEGKNGVFNESFVDVGKIRFNAYNLGKLDFDYFQQNWEDADFRSSLLDAMDMDSSDANMYYCVFGNDFDKIVSKISEDAWTDMAMAITEGYLITLDRCYINPKYRNMGVGKFIHENLFKILYTKFNITPLFVVGVCVPDKGEPENMLELQKKVLIDTGFDVFECCNQTAFCKYIYDAEFLAAI